MSKLKDMTNQHVGRLTIIERSEDRISPRGKHTVMWKCICDCQLLLPENEKRYIYVSGESLRSGHTQSCGCYLADKLKERKTYNSYKFDGDIGIGFDSSGNEFLFDKEDYDKIKDYYWHMRYDGYFLGHKSMDKSPSRLHRIIMNVSNKDIVVDHIDHNPSNNRKENLRIANKSQNARNHKIFSSNTSGCSGVVFSKVAGKWAATIMVNYQSIHLGLFDNYDDAVIARKEAEKKYFGDFQYQGDK